MQPLPISLPPGIRHNGTQYQNKGRWWQSNLVRFYEGTVGPEGGWAQADTSGGPITGMGRAIITWNDNSDDETWCAVGTEQKLYCMSRSGALSDITPTGFTAGRADAAVGGGFGGGAFGAGTFGSPRPDSSVVEEASMWSFDTFGQYLVGVMAEDGNQYQWELNSSTPAAAISGAPTATSLFVTQEGMQMALGAGGIPRSVAWCDQQDNTDWTPSSTNQAGDFDLQTSGQLLQGLKVNGGFLLLTNLDCWGGEYLANELVYGFERQSNGCGGVSRNCGVALDSQAVWMGRAGFWLWNGYVSALPCEVWDAVFGNLNTLQISKVTVEMNTQFGEVRWNYPSAGSTEIDSFVVWNYRENHWRTGSQVRLAGCDQGVTQYPMRVGVDGHIYNHEFGWSYDENDTPYLESGPVELLNGNFIYDAEQLLSDDLNPGDVTVTFFSKFAPDGQETEYGPFTISGAYTDTRFPFRQLRIRFDGVNSTGWRIGIPRLSICEAINGDR